MEKVWVVFPISQPFIYFTEGCFSYWGLVVCVCSSWTAPCLQVWERLGKGERVERKSGEKKRKQMKKAWTNGKKGEQMEKGLKMEKPRQEKCDLNLTRCLCLCWLPCLLGNICCCFIVRKRFWIFTHFYASWQYLLWFLLVLNFHTFWCNKKPEATSAVVHCINKHYFL